MLGFKGKLTLGTTAAQVNHHINNPRPKRGNLAEQQEHPPSKVLTMTGMAQKRVLRAVPSVPVSEHFHRVSAGSEWALNKNNSLSHGPGNLREHLKFGAQ